MTEFTKGPWKVLEKTEADTIEGSDGFDIVEIIDYSNLDRIKMQKANARLIAAAPELRSELIRSTETMEELVKYLRRYMPDDVRIQGLEIQIRGNRAAIAKATGG